MPILVQSCRNISNEDKVYLKIRWQPAWNETPPPKLESRSHKLRLTPTEVSHNHATTKWQGILPEMTWGHCCLKLKEFCRQSSWLFAPIIKSIRCLQPVLPTSRGEIFAIIPIHSHFQEVAACIPSNRRVWWRRPQEIFDVSDALIAPVNIMILTQKSSRKRKQHLLRYSIYQRTGMCTNQTGSMLFLEIDRSQLQRSK